MKWLALIFIGCVAFFLANHHYGRLYFIEAYSNEALRQTNARTSKNANHFFVDNYVNFYEITRENYIIRITAEVSNNPFLSFRVFGVDYNDLELINHAEKFQSDCGGFSSTTLRDGTDVTVLMIGNCSEEERKAISDQVITFDVVDTNNDIIGNEQFKIRIHKNGFYMTPRGSL